MKRFKSFSMFLMIVMSIMLVLAGCKSKESSNDGDKNDKSKEETYELTMAFPAFTKIDDLPLVQDEINKITKEKINATVKLMPIGAAAWAQQSNLMLTGNEKLDLIVATAPLYQLQAAKGQLIPLDGLLKTHGKGITEAVPSNLLEGVKVGGEIYGIPSMRDIAVNFGFLMRKDIVDKYNIDLSQVKTWEDLGPVFETVKQNEPNIVPVAAEMGTTIALGGLYDTLGDTLGVIAINDDKIINMYEDSNYEAAIKLARKWYESGYIMKDAATSQEAQANIVKAGKAFGYFANMKPGFAKQEQNITGFEMVEVTLTDNYLLTTAAAGVNMAIARNSENPEKAMEMMNLLYTDKDIMNLIANGIEGKHYQVKDDGTIKLPDGVTESNYVFNQWLIGNNFLTYPWEGNSPQLWDEMKEFNESAIVSPALGFTFNPDPVKTEIAACTNVLNQYKAGLATGTLDPDKSLPEFNKKLKEAGIDKIIAEKQKQFDAWKK
ncbi:ABC transporter substrate-binding protein [Ferdinandcohnia quinoae]|uniref:ABC transporter substrate-binding protein n=1 Tax=Fredinandcohnia quinoae TaxID=2918902 RepID=A0AAW5DUP7_9BACI|nr:ABC transporter substrate-binding protein [Fredinandcohnia sp. SECRCQ15]MCH1624362.1 ABC transporter substrate-binding protein [Fredinandcohnia sp. SECRCQ15]